MPIRQAMPLPLTPVHAFRWAFLTLRPAGALRNQMPPDFCS
jgi:hypothetical protein